MRRGAVTGHLQLSIAGRRRSLGADPGWPDAGARLKGKNWRMAHHPADAAARGPESRPVAVVTGAARGLGRVVASTLARAGHRLVLVDRSPVADTAADVEAAGSEA